MEYDEQDNHDGFLYKRYRIRPGRDYYREGWVPKLWQVVVLIVVIIVATLTVSRLVTTTDFNSCPYPVQHKHHSGYVPGQIVKINGMPLCSKVERK